MQVTAGRATPMGQFRLRFSGRGAVKQSNRTETILSLFLAHKAEDADLLEDNNVEEATAVMPAADAARRT